MWKNLVYTQSNSDTTARWSSITFFWYTLYENTMSSITVTDKRRQKHNTMSSAQFPDHYILIDYGFSYSNKTIL
jgi:hypothetical protein